MQYFGTNFCLTLGGMRLRLAFMLEDAPDEPAGQAHGVAAAGAPAQHAPYDRVHSN